MRVRVCRMKQVFRRAGACSCRLAISKIANGIRLFVFLEFFVDFFELFFLAAVG